MPITSRGPDTAARLALPAANDHAPAAATVGPTGAIMRAAVDALAGARRLGAGRPRCGSARGPARCARARPPRARIPRRRRPCPRAGTAPNRRYRGSPRPPPPPRLVVPDDEDLRPEPGELDGREAPHPARGPGEQHRLPLHAPVRRGVLSPDAAS